MFSIEEKNFKIIIVDENVQFRNILASRLRILGFNVELVSGGFHLIHTIEEYNYNLIIMHENMSDMSAEEMISLVRIQKNKGELPILFIAKDSKEEELCEIMQNGANEYIVKSANFQPIVDRAQKYFNLMKASQ